MNFNTPPYLSQNVSVQRVMLQVLAALLPGIAVYAWLIGPVVLVQIAIATIAALLGEAFMLRLLGKPLGLFLGDGSAVVTAWLIALAFPPLAPWWLIVIASLFAIVVAKHLYGGLGQNPFNPAMIAFAICIVSFPALMSQWPAIDMKSGFADQLALVFGFAPRLDAISGAAPLDALKAAVKLRLGDDRCRHFRVLRRQWLGMGRHRLPAGRTLALAAQNHSVAGAFGVSRRHRPALGRALADEPGAVR